MSCMAHFTDSGVTLLTMAIAIGQTGRSLRATWRWATNWINQILTMAITRAREFWIMHMLRLKTTSSCCLQKVRSSLGRATTTSLIWTRHKSAVRVWVQTILFWSVRKEVQEVLAKSVKAIQARFPEEAELVLPMEAPTAVMEARVWWATSWTWMATAIRTSLLIEVYSTPIQQENCRATTRVSFPVISHLQLRIRLELRPVASWRLYLKEAPPMQKARSQMWVAQK